MEPSIGEAARRFSKHAVRFALQNLERLGELLGGSADELPAGRAQVEVTQSKGSEAIPTSVEMEVGIEETVTEVQAGSAIAKDFLESDAIQTCFRTVMTEAFKQDPDLDAFAFRVQPGSPSSPAPRDGARMAFAVEMELPRIATYHMQMEMYFWTYSNADVSVYVFGDQKDIAQELVSAVLKAAETKLTEAGD